MLAAAAALLLVALGLDNTALAAAIPAEGRNPRRAALPLGAAALALTLIGALGGRLAYHYLRGWAPLMGAVLVFALWVDALQLFSRGQPRWLPGDSPADGALLRRIAAACSANLDELGVGFAFGTLAVGALWTWGAACAVETALALALGLRLAGRSSGGPLALGNAIALFAGSALALFGSVLLIPPVSPP